MQRRIEIDCALSSMMPKALPDAPFPLTGELFNTIGQKATSRLRPF